MQTAERKSRQPPKRKRCKCQGGGVFIFGSSESNFVSFVTERCHNKN